MFGHVTIIQQFDWRTQHSTSTLLLYTLLPGLPFHNRSLGTRLQLTMVELQCTVIPYLRKALKEFEGLELVIGALLSSQRSLDEQDPYYPKLSQR